MPTEYFEQRERALLGERFDALYAAPQETAERGVTVSALRTTPEQFAAKADFSLEASPFCKAAFVVHQPDFKPGRHPYHHAGVFYSQEPSASSAAPLLGVRPGMRVLDMCAAPGGKSSQLAAALQGRGVLVSNEYVAARADILKSNLERMGVSNAVVLNESPARIADALPEFFDRVLVDAPCSGEGMFRKDTDSTGEWSVDNVRLCASRGRRIIHDIWNALKPGGILIYSTCTYNTEEDEENIHYIIEELGAEALPIPTQEEWQITGALRFEHPVYRFFPHKTRGEGFFLAALRKAEGEIEEIRVKSKGKKERGKAAPSIPQEARQFLSDETSFSLEWNDSFLRAYPKAHSDLFSLINAKPLRVLSAGICLGEAKGKDFIPSQELALSTALTPNAFPSVELEWEDAIKFLKKEALVLPSGTDKGYVLVRYQGLPLGFVKNLGNRANNLYPQEWRIRTGYIPEEIKLFLGR